MVNQKQMRDELEQSHQRVQTLESAVQHKEKELRDVEETKGSLQAQLADSESRCEEERQRHAREAQQIAQDFQRELQQAREEVQQLTQELDRVQRLHLRAEHEKHSAELQKAQMEERMQRQLKAKDDQVKELQGSEQALQEKVRMATGAQASLEAQSVDRDHRLAASESAARRLEGEKRVLEVELEKVKNQLRESEQVKNQLRESEQETRDMRCRTAVLENELRDRQEQCQRLQHDQQKAARDIEDAIQDSNQWRQKFVESNKEKAVLQKANQELAVDVWSFATTHQAESAARIYTPGELSRLMKVPESEALVNNKRLEYENQKLRKDLEVCHMELHQRDAHLKELQHSRSCQKANAGA